MNYELQFFRAYYNELLYVKNGKKPTKHQTSAMLLGDKETVFRLFSVLGDIKWIARYLQDKEIMFA